MAMGHLLILLGRLRGALAGRGGTVKREARHDDGGVDSPQRQKETKEHEGRSKKQDLPPHLQP